LTISGCYNCGTDATGTAISGIVVGLAAVGAMGLANGQNSVIFQVLSAWLKYGNNAV